MIKHKTRSIITQLAVLALLAGASAPLLANSAGLEAPPVERIKDIYRSITTYHILLQGEGVTQEMVSSALYDVERYVEEIDSRFETEKLFIDDQRKIDEMAEWVAKAHFQAALLHAKGVDLEGSIDQYEEVVNLLGYDPAEWQIDIERGAQPGLLPSAGEIVFEIASPREVLEDLKGFWSSGVVTRFAVQEFTPSQRRVLRIERIGGRTDPFSRASFELASERFAERAARGLEELRVVLPPGHYRVVATDQSFPALEFKLRAGEAPDPIIVNPNTFTFEFANQQEGCSPQLMLNGLPVQSLAALPYGSFRVTTPAGCKMRLPDKIVVEQNSQVTLRTEPERLDYAKEGQPIFLFITTPPGSTYTLRM